MEKPLNDEVQTPTSRREKLFIGNLGLRAWNVMTGLSMFLPLFAFTVARIANREEDGNSDEYNEAYREWRQCSEYGDDKWYKYWCNKPQGYYDEDGNYQEYESEDEGEMYAPWWWRSKANNEEEEDSSTVFVMLYIWTIILVAGLVFVVNRNYGQGKLKTVRWFLVGWAVYASTIVLLLGGIPELILEEGQELEEIGFYGQTAVLNFITVFLELMTCAFFACWVGRLIKIESQDLQKEIDEEAPYNAL